MSFNHIRDDVSSKWLSKKTYFTVDLIWWSLLRLAEIILFERFTEYFILVDYVLKNHAWSDVRNMHVTEMM